MEAGPLQPGAVWSPLPSPPPQQKCLSVTAEPVSHVCFPSAPSSGVASGLCRAQLLGGVGWGGGGGCGAASGVLGQAWGTWRRLEPRPNDTERVFFFCGVFFVKKNALFCEECADGCNSRRSGESSPAGLVSTVTRERPQPGPALSQA